MTTTNREIFYRDPTDTKIPNDGVAKVIRPETDQQWDVLRWELRSFVCDGQYARGLERILDSFLKNLTQSEQPAAWVSGFYGSGKSHLVRVLEHLWRDVELPGGDRARELVSLPDDVSDHLVELSTEGKRNGGLWSAAGTLASGKSDEVRIAFLSVLFEAAGLPEQYPLARFMIWAKENGYLDHIREAVTQAGRTLDKEIHDLYVSPLIAKALLEVDPSLGDTVKDVRDLLKTQFPPTTRDIDRDEMLDVMERVLAFQSTTDGKVPLTLIVLDEMQQYIGDDNEKAITVQLIAEDCSSRFENQVLIVATGQSALTATPTLQKLTERFTVMVPAVRQGCRVGDSRSGASQAPRVRPGAQVHPRVGERRDRQAPCRNPACPEGGRQARSRARLPPPTHSPEVLGTGAPRDRPRRQSRASCERSSGSCTRPRPALPESRSVTWWELTSSTTSRRRACCRVGFSSRRSMN